MTARLSPPAPAKAAGDVAVLRNLLRLPVLSYGRATAMVMVALSFLMALAGNNARAQWEVSLPGRYPVPDFLRESSKLPLRDAAYKGRSYFFYFGSKEGQIFHAEIHILPNGRDSAAKFAAMKDSIAIPEIKTNLPPETASMGDDCSVRGTNPARPAAVLFREGRVIFFLTGPNALSEGTRLHRIWWTDSGASIVAQLTEIEPRLRLVPLYEGGVPPIADGDDDASGSTGYSSSSTHDAHAVHGPDQAVPALVALLNSQDPTERVYAVVRLRTLGNATLTSKLTPLLAVQERHGVRIQVLRTLGAWKAIEALPSILEILDAPPGQGRRTDIGSDRLLKNEAVAAVARIANVAASARLRDLIRASAQDADFRQLCVAALIAIEGKPAIVKAKPQKSTETADADGTTGSKRKKQSDKQTRVRVMRTEE